MRSLCLLAAAVCAVTSAQETPPPPPAEQTDELGRTKQDSKRIFGLLPNYRTTSAHDAAKLSAGAKFKIAFRDATDPGAFVTTGVLAGFSHSGNQFPSLGQGMKGYGKRYGLLFADNASAAFFVEAITPTLLHQDPRYFRRGQGSALARTAYAISRIAVVRGDNGRAQPNGPELLGNFGAASFGNLYFPSAERNLHNTLVRFGMALGKHALSNVLREFAPDIERKLSRKQR